MSNPIRHYLKAESGTITAIDQDLLVGRSEACDLIITEGHPSRQHARITLEEDRVFIEDLESANGTFVNRTRIHDKRELFSGDSLAFGLYQLDFFTEGVSADDTTDVQLVDPDQTVVYLPNITEASDEPKRFALHGQNGDELISFDETIVVGRDTKDSEHVGLIIENMGVSSLHAQLKPDETGVLISDLDSANGTYINDQRIDQPTVAKNDDRLRFHLIEVVLSDRQAAQDTGSKIEENSSSVDEGDPLSTENPYLELGDTAEKGGTVIMPISPAVPPAWLETDSTGTVLVDAAELKRMNAAQYDNDTARLEQTVEAPTLLILSGAAAGRPYKLEVANDVNYWNIGRDGTKHDLSIIIDDPSVSDFHAKLVCRQGRWQVIDQMSTNSVYVNGNRHSSAFLTSTDRVRIGRVETMLLLPTIVAEVKPSWSASWYSKILTWLGIQ